MIICFDCSLETKKILDSLIESGQYDNYSEAISLAIKNQAIIQKEVLRSGDLIIGGADGNVKDTKRTSSSQIKGANKVSKKKDDPTESLKIPEIFHIDVFSGSTPPLANLPDDIWAVGQEISLDRWIFGQYNRLLPAKASSRALARLILDQPKGVLLDDTTRQIAKEAAILGIILAQSDKHNKIARDDTLSTAFPSTGNNSEKSQKRYANQFVASVNKQGQVSGLLMDLKLINSTGIKATRLLLTEIGWKFATLPNPVLDDFQDTPTQKFTDDEINILLRHIAQSIPVEDYAYRVILRTIIEGNTSPDAVDSALLKIVPMDSERSLSKSFLSSQRSGAISRMTDLELLRRHRDGVRVTYAVTDIGKKYLQNTQ